MNFMASSAFFTGTIGRIGPKISSCITLVSGSTSVSTVGAEKEISKMKMLQKTEMQNSHLTFLSSGHLSIPSLFSPKYYVNELYKLTISKHVHQGILMQTKEKIYTQIQPIHSYIHIRRLCLHLSGNIASLWIKIKSALLFNSSTFLHIISLTFISTPLDRLRKHLNGQDSLTLSSVFRLLLGRGTRKEGNTDTEKALQSVTVSMLSKSSGSNT